MLVRLEYFIWHVVDHPWLEFKQLVDFRLRLHLERLLGLLLKLLLMFSEWLIRTIFLFNLLMVETPIQLLGRMLLGFGLGDFADEHFRTI